MARTPIRFSLKAAATVVIVALLATLWPNGSSPSEAQQGSMHNCPQAGRWAISVWDGDNGTEADQAFATCGESAVDAAYYLHPQSQTWLRWFVGRPEVSNLDTLDDMQGVIALGGSGALAPTSTASSAQQGAMQNCPLKGKWAISTWSGSDGTAAANALATCGTNGVDAAYYLDPQTQGWLRWFKGRPDLSSLATLNDLEAVIALGGEGDTIIVTGTADSGPGTLRQALLDAQSGDTITFDTVVFPPNTPATIPVTSELPHVSQGNLTIDASNAGVILDGSNIPEDFVSGLELVSSGNTIRGLQVSNFSVAGIAVHYQYNTVGGSRNVGTGPFGQGNLTTGNAMGIGLWVDGTSFNIVKGNLVGTDASGTEAWGNSGNGVRISGGASHNIIGPDNLVAHNGAYGIEIVDPGSVGNTISQNSIHDNERGGIDLWDGGNTELPAPLITDFNLAAGTIAGATCASCMVEVFTDSSDEGELYEGATTADGTGAFAFNRGASFSGSHLTATATDTHGNTSEFSLPTSGSSRSWVLQEGNNLPKKQLETKPSIELADNRIGLFFHNLWQPFDYEEILNAEIARLGAKRVKLTINEGEPVSMSGDTESRIDWSKPEFSIDPVHDQFISDLASHGIIITYLLNFWDKANHPSGWQPAESRFKTEEEIQRYLEYVRFIVRHFKNRIQYYEIWNEPDVPTPLHWIQVDDYVDLVKRTVPVIRQEYPEAKIVVGGIILQNPTSRDWLFSLLGSDVMPLVDVVSWHPMFGVSPEHNGQYYYEYPSLAQEIKDVASGHGFRGEYRGDELLWRSTDCYSCAPHDPLESNIAAAKYYARGIVTHLGIDVTAGTAGVSSLRRESFSAVQNLCTIMAGAQPVSLPAEIESEATNIASYGFSLTNGDKLFALWTDGAAVDDDPGVEATLTLAGLSGQDVSGIDVLYGFEQELITDTEGGDLVIRDLLVKDYPIILRFSGVTSS